MSATTIYRQQSSVTMAHPLEVRMTSLKRTARIAGLWYLGFTLGPFYLLYVPSKTIVPHDASATAARILSHETLYRWGMHPR